MGAAGGHGHQVMAHSHSFDETLEKRAAAAAAAAGSGQSPMGQQVHSYIIRVFLHNPKNSSNLNVS